MKNASAIEIIWTLIALVGTGLSLRSWWQARGDLEFLIAHNYNGKRRITGHAHRRREMLRACTQGIFATVGIVALLRPAPPESAAGLALLLTLASAIIVINTQLDIRVKQRLTHYWETVDMRHVQDRDAVVAADAAVQAAQTETLHRIEVASDKAATAAEKVATDLTVAKEAVAGVASDLKESHDRADETTGPHGAAADAASKSLRDKK